jgi:hypothetical protein
VRPPSRKLGTEVRRRNRLLENIKEDGHKRKVFKKLQISKRVVLERLHVR